MTKRHMAVLALAWVCAIPSVASGQAAEWKEFVSKEDRFGANFPGDPVRTEVPWETEYGAKLTAHVYTAKDGQRTYSMTVVDYNPVQAILTAKADACEDLTSERCTGHTSFSGPGYWKNDVRGAMIYAAFKFMQRDVKITHYMWNYLGMGVEVNEMQMVSNVDKSRTWVSMYMHHNRLYVMEGNVPSNYPNAGLFTQSISLFEEDGKRASHGHVVFNGAEVELNEVSARRDRPGQRQGGAAPGEQAAPAGR